MTSRPSSIDQAARAWGPEPPDWVAALAAACDAAGSSQGMVARRLGISRAAVSQVLAGKYRSATDRIEARIRGVLMLETVDCPVLGPLPRQRCIELQAAPRPKNGDPIMSRLHAACRGGCPHSRLPGRSR